MDVTVEVKDRFKRVSELLEEIVCILHDHQTENEQSRSYTCVCNCDCGQKTTPKKFSKQINLTSGTDDQESKTKHQSNVYCTDKQLKHDEFDWKNNTSNVTESGSFSKKNCNTNYDQDDLECICNCLRNRSNNKQNNNEQKICAHEQFKKNLKDIKQRFTKYFDDINRD